MLWRWCHWEPRWFLADHLKVRGTALQDYIMALKMGTFIQKVSGSTLKSGSPGKLQASIGLMPPKQPHGSGSWCIEVSRKRKVSAETSCCLRALCSHLLRSPPEVWAAMGYEEGDIPQRKIPGWLFKECDKTHKTNFAIVTILKCVNPLTLCYPHHSVQQPPQCLVP